MGEGCYMDRKYAEFAAQKAIELLAIDSPSGFADKATDWVVEEFSSLGFKAKKTVKGSAEQTSTTRFYWRRTRTLLAEWCAKSKATADLK